MCFISFLTACCFSFSVAILMWYSGTRSLKISARDTMTSFRTVTHMSGSVSFSISLNSRSFLIWEINKVMKHYAQLCLLMAHKCERNHRGFFTCSSGLSIMAPDSNAIRCFFSASFCWRCNNISATESAGSGFLTLGLGTSDSASCSSVF